MATLFVTHPDCDAHVTPPGHPEQVARLEHVRAALEGPGCASLLRAEAPIATDADIGLCHPAGYLARIHAAIPEEGWAALDGDTHVSPGSERAARRAVGGNIAAVDAVLERRAGNAFVACRPPGHHAEAERAMGFCLFGNVAIAAKHALERHGLERVAILDFDVHHGNGTQALMWAEPRCFYASSHQVPLFPGSGLPNERGATGNVLNVPLEPGSGSREMRECWERRILPALRNHAPELILVSAGFDAHRADPLASLNWGVEDFRWLTGQICSVADELCDGRVVSTLEGGYDLAALAASAAAHVEVLMEHAG